MSTPQDIDALEVDGELLEMAPTVELASGGAPPAVRQVALVAGTQASLRSETHSLLRSRLRAVSILLLIVYGMVQVWIFLNRGSATEGLTDALQSINLFRLVGLGLVLAVLSSSRSTSQELLRGIEYSLFGVLTLLWVYARYQGIQTSAAAGDVTGLLLDGRTSMIGLFMLIVVHGIFLPHRWHETARVVLTMALAPVLVLVIYEIRHPELTRQVADLMSWQYVSTNILVVLVGAVLACYASHILNGLRADVHEAKQYGQYKLGKKLGSGGMGDVFLAEHVLMKRPCALKQIRPEVSGDQTALSRFELEVETTASLTHPHTIEIYDYGHTEDGAFYYVMEYLPGLSLHEFLEHHGPISPARTIYLLRQTCSALAEAHAAGLIHRDLKPGNLYISERGGLCDFVKVLDFGLVKRMHQAAGEQLTADHAISGTPLYMSPEQALGNHGLDPRCDLYALGAIAYHMLTGQPPFPGDNPMAVMIAHVKEDVSPLTNIRADIPDDLQQVVLRCLSKEPDDRFADATEMDRALAACAAAGDWDAQQAAVWWHDYYFATNSNTD